MGPAMSRKDVVGESSAAGPHRPGMARRGERLRDWKLLGYDVADNAEAEKLGVAFFSLRGCRRESRATMYPLHAAGSPPKTRNLLAKRSSKHEDRAPLIIPRAGARIDEPAACGACFERRWIAAAVGIYVRVRATLQGRPFRCAAPRSVLLTPIKQVSRGRGRGCSRLFRPRASLI